MKKIYAFLRALMVAIIFICSFSGWATDRYISPAGSNITGNGTIGSPWKTLKHAISNSVAGDVIHAAAGVYPCSNVMIDKSLTITGEASNRELVILVPDGEDGNADNAFGNSVRNGLVVKAHNVTIQHLTLNGRGNPALTPGKDNFRAAIVTYDPYQIGGNSWNNLHVNNVFIRHAYRRGISVWPLSVSGTLVENSRVDSVAYNQAIYLGGQGRALNNTINHCFQGIVLNPDGTTPDGVIEAVGNTLNNTGNFPGCWGDQGGGSYSGQPRGLEFNNTLSPLRTVNISGNVLNAFGNGAVGIYTVKAGNSSTVTGNTITFNSFDSKGMVLGWSYGDGFVVSGNTIQVGLTGTGIAIYGSGSGAHPMDISGNTLTGAGSIYVNPGNGTGVVISNKYLSGPDTGPSTVMIRNGNIISGFDRGIDVVSLVTPSPPVLAIEISNNEIYNNTGYGVISSATNGITARDNWWGSCTGPYNVPSNPAGLGNPVKGNINFSPWISLPVAPGAIAGPEIAYQGQNGLAYYTEPVAHATGYTWTLPAGATIASGGGTNSILVNFSASAASGDISVSGLNDCGNGPAVSKNINVLTMAQNVGLNNITVNSGETSCYNALQTIRVAGDAGPYTIRAGGSITMIAGQNIRYLFGTTVEAGGYLHGMINTTNSWCGQQPLAPGTTGQEPVVASGSGTDFFRVYPNPTQGRFTLELNAGEETAGGVVKVYGLTGGLIMEQSLEGKIRNEFSLEQNPAGIYVIRVVKSDKTGTVKIIRQQ